MLDKTADRRPSPPGLFRRPKKSRYSTTEEAARRSEGDARATSYRDHRRTEDFAKLVELAEPLLTRWASAYGNTGMDFDEAMQIAILALEKAARKFRPEEFDASIFTFAAYHVREALNIARHSQGLSGAGGMANIALCVRKEIRLHNGDVEAGIKAYCERTHYRPETIEALYWGSEPLYSIYVSDDDGGYTNLADTLPDGTTEDTFLDPIEHRSQYREARFAIETVVRADLNPARARKIFFCVFQDGRTLDELAAELGISRERIRQIAMRLMGRVRAAMGIVNANAPASLFEARSRAPGKADCAEEEEALAA